MWERRQLIICLVFALASGAALADEGDDSSDEGLEPFPLLEKGIVFGAGFGLHAGGWGHPKLDGLATVGFAYAGVLPGYWSPFSGATTKRYCAASWSQDAADHKAAKATYGELSPNDLRKKLAAEKKMPREQRLKGEIYRTTRWLVGVKGVCWPRMFGLFAALPSDFDANVRASSKDKPISRNVRPVVSFGLLLAPRPYVHLLIGATFSHVVLEEGGTDERSWSGFFAVGTTIGAIVSVF
jgi:hypothetical protein